MKELCFKCGRPSYPKVYREELGGGWDSYLTTMATCSKCNYQTHRCPCTELKSNVKRRIRKLEQEIETLQGNK